MFAVHVHLLWFRFCSFLEGMLKASFATKLKFCEYLRPHVCSYLSIFYSNIGGKKGKKVTSSKLMYLICHIFSPNLTILSPEISKKMSIFRNYQQPIRLSFLRSSTGLRVRHFIITMTFFVDYDFKEKKVSSRNGSNSLQ